MENRAQSLQAIWRAIEKGNRFFIAGHLNPDGDSLGCTLAMTSLLERMGKTVYAYASPAIGADLQFLPGISKIHVDQLPEKIDFDTVILLECSDRKRGGDLEKILTATHTLINIDHHLVSDAYGDVNHIDSGASSTAEIIFQLFEESEGNFLPNRALHWCSHRHGAFCPFQYYRRRVARSLSLSSVGSEHLQDQSSYLFYKTLY